MTAKAEHRRAQGSLEPRSSGTEVVDPEGRGGATDGTVSPPAITISLDRRVAEGGRADPRDHEAGGNEEHRDDQLEEHDDEGTREEGAGEETGDDGGDEQADDEDDGSEEGAFRAQGAIGSSKESSSSFGGGTAWHAGPAGSAGHGSRDSTPGRHWPSGTFGGFRDSDPSFEDLPAMGKADPLIGVVVADRYRIVEAIGRGGMGIVYKVEHTRIGKLLAMKLLTGELSRNTEVVRRFKQEALTASKLSCPSTVQVFDFGVSEGLTYLVMELVAGEDLGRVLRHEGAMPFSRLGTILVQVCASLAEAHHKGIVHRDIKPENIMLARTREGAELAKVLDFGLAKLREGAELSDMTTQGAIVGTPYFMSPEQVRGEPVDARSDIYSLGAVMYRALTGHHPFTGPTPMAVFTKHLTESPVPPVERAPQLGIPGPVSDVVLRCLAKGQEDRFQRVEDVKAALLEQTRALGGERPDEVLEPAEVGRLAKSVARIPADTATAIGLGPAAAVAIATRDEIEAYERKLRRQRYSAIAFAGAFAVAAMAGSAQVALSSSEQTFSGSEIEPNDRASDATPIPIGRSVSGYLGRRIDPTSSDCDFYSIDVPADVPAAGEAPPAVRLTVTALPNFAACTLLFRAGFENMLYQYCVGRPGRDLRIPQLRLDPGRYFLAVKQDLDKYGAVASPFVHENVSDAYVLSVEMAEPSPDLETEPNDRVASANPIEPGRSLGGSIAWARDEDVYCVPKDAGGPIRWTVTDVVRDAGSVLEVTRLSGLEEAAAVRVHAGGKGAASGTDVRTPWTSAPVADPRDAPRCLRVRLVADPWLTAGATPSVIPSGGAERYTVGVEPGP